MTLHVSMLLVLEVDVDVSVQLRSAPIGLEISVYEIFLSQFFKFFDAYALSLKMIISFLHKRL